MESLVTEYTTTRSSTLNVGVDKAIDPNLNRPDGNGWRLVSSAIVGCLVVFWWQRESDDAYEPKKLEDRVKRYDQALLDVNEALGLIDEASGDLRLKEIRRMAIDGHRADAFREAMERIAKDVVPQCAYDIARNSLVVDDALQREKP